MATRQTTSRELKQYLTEWLDTAFENGLINSQKRETTLSQMSLHLPKLVTELNRPRAISKLNLGRTVLTVSLHEGLDPDHGPFNLFRMRWAGGKRPKRLNCFLGHRFLPKIKRALRSNLRYILEASKIDLQFADRDLNARGFFDDIVSKIRDSDFCIFDNREASEKPNVYIEAGIAYALRTPFILANYLPNRVGVPSDLAHVNNIQYKHYSELTKKIYFSLPVFLRANRLRGQ